MINHIVKFVVFFLTCFICAVLQASFLPYFSIWGAVPNLIFIAFFLSLFFLHKKELWQGFFLAISAGFFMDVIYLNRFGISMVALLVIYFLHTLILSFFQESRGRNLIFNFMVEFSVLFLAYQSIIYIFSKVFVFSFEISTSVLISLVYSLCFATMGFYICQKLFYQSENSSQLKLL